MLGINQPLDKNCSTLSTRFLSLTEKSSSIMNGSLKYVKIVWINMNWNEKGMNKKHEWLQWFSHERLTIHFNLIPASISSPAGRGLELIWSGTSTSWPPHREHQRTTTQRLCCEKVIGEHRKGHWPLSFCKQIASGNEKRLSNMMSIKDHSRKTIENQSQNLETLHHTLRDVW